MKSSIIEIQYHYENKILESIFIKADAGTWAYVADHAGDFEIIEMKYSSYKKLNEIFHIIHNIANGLFYKRITYFSLSENEKLNRFLENHNYKKYSYNEWEYIVEHYKD